MERIFYEEAARNFAKSWRRDVNDHIINIITSVMMARDKVVPGGGFVNAVLDNNLHAAITLGDEEVLKELKLITLAKTQAFVQ